MSEKRSGDGNCIHCIVSCRRREIEWSSVFRWRYTSIWMRVFFIYFKSKEYDSVPMTGILMSESVYNTLCRPIYGCSDGKCADFFLAILRVFYEDDERKTAGATLLKHGRASLNWTGCHATKYLSWKYLNVKRINGEYVYEYT